MGHLVNVGTQHCIDLGLIAFALATEKLHHVGIHAPIENNLGLMLLLLFSGTTDYINTRQH